MNGNRRIDELLRVNAELAEEIRSLTAGRAGAPRPGQAPAARAVALLSSERDQLAERLRQTEAKLAAVQADRDGLERQNQEMDAEIVYLRSGFAGFLRRLRGRFLNR